MSAVGAIVLAAGRSTRMGGPNKLIQTLGGKPLVRHAAEAALASTARPVVVVTGHDADAVRAALAGLSVAFTHNPAFATGLSTSLDVGLAALPDTAAGAVVMLADMPRVSGRIIDALVAAFEARPDVAAVVPTLSGEWGNPVLLARRIFAEVEALSGDEGARRLLVHRQDVLAVPIDDTAVAMDVDTPEALAALRRGEG
ncbi:nucleotidyltransferase family protein [Chelatococcus sp. SYSU_G07232]|uniref:Nucleotidyltransferase family protein n=1 Tax=Chelatococcus albus TaxID=3047466 RepID=A0ABT7AG85_9HYPH|nr:nucleotidyltransferase family protein [Chelatococcus sp. SYSU_G07232]MDJ1158387.1 nucleotidyltransferase family protein [Chelatococcus sp. SYSU_G07232]